LFDHNSKVASIAAWSLRPLSRHVDRYSQLVVFSRLEAKM
jgi:hypothetical protein